MKLTTWALLGLCSPLLAPLLRADTITGRVVDVNGVGVAGVDIDVNNMSSGGNPHLTNDGTDANGFFTATLDAGVFQVLFKPPPPPATTDLTAIVNNVVVVGTKNMGTITLARGVSVSGRALDQSAIGVAGVKIVVTDTLTGAVLVMNNAATDAFGNFSVAVPKNLVHVDLDTITVVGRNLVPRRIDVAPSANVNLGNLTLLDGFVLSGTVRNPSGTGLSGVDLDVFDSATGTKLFTPHDNTTSVGDFAIVLAPGTYDVKACPAFALHLVSAEVFALPLAADTNMGALTLPNGAVLSGVVRDVNGSPIAAVDVNAKTALTRVDVPLCADNTGASGSYAVIVPFDTLDISFALPGEHGTSGEDLHAALAISGNTALDGILPAPRADFSATPLTGAPPLAVTFNDLSSGALSGWSWSFGDSSTSSARNPIHTYAVAGTYTVALTVSGPGGPDTKTRAGYVVVGDSAPVASFSGSPTSGPAPLLVAFSNQSTGTITSHAWSFGDGGSSTLAAPSHSYSTPGTYSVALTESGPGGTNTLTRTDYIVVNVPAPAAEFAGTPTSGTQPLLVSFSNQSTGTITSHAWTFGDGGTSTLASPSHTYTTVGSFTVTLTETGPGGSNTRTRSAYIAVSDSPPGAEFVGTPTSGVEPLVVSFTDQSSGVVTSRAWSFGDGATSSEASPVHTYTAPGTYTVSLTATGPGGANMRTRTDYIVVDPAPPLAEFSGTPLRGVAPHGVRFTDLSGGRVTSWTWDFGDGGLSHQRNPIHVYMLPGVYTVSLTASGPGGVDTETKPAYVFVHGATRAGAPTGTSSRTIPIMGAGGPPVRPQDALDAARELRAALLRVLERRDPLRSATGG